MELIIGENGHMPDPKPITAEERAAVRALKTKGKTSVVVKPKPGPFFELCTLATINELWPWVSEGLERIKKKDPHSGPWTPQHVRARIDAGFAGAPVQLWFVKKS